MDYWDSSHLDRSMTVIEGRSDPEWWDTGILDQWGDPVFRHLPRRPAGFIHHPEPEDE